MTVDEIKNGIVIDHITAGKGMQIYKLLKLGSLDASVALINNAPSRKMGKKDIIKIDADISLDTDILGYVDPDITVNVIKDGIIIEKKAIELPERLTNVLTCKKSSDKISFVILGNNKQNAYTPETYEQRLLRYAYLSYLKGDNKKAIKYFEKLTREEEKYEYYLYSITFCIANKVYF